MNAIAFTVKVDEDDGGFYAFWDDPRGGGITTQGETLVELEAMIEDAVACHFEEHELPSEITLSFTDSPGFSPPHYAKVSP